MNILFVCTGNTCRSPMAEGIFKKLVLDKELQGFNCQSAGLSTQNGMSASFFAVEVCKEIGIDISKHKSKMITLDMLKNTDIFFVMTSSHKNALLNCGISEEKIYLPDNDICDPFMGDVEIYRKCCRQIFKELEKLIEVLV